VTCKDCLCEKVCGKLIWKEKDGTIVCDDFKDKTRFCELPCNVGDTGYFYKAELEEICPAFVIKIEHNYFTPSMPFWITVQYKSKLLGTQENKMCEEVFNLLWRKTREQAEQALRERKEDSNA